MLHMPKYSCSVGIDDVLSELIFSNSALKPLARKLPVDWKLALWSYELEIFASRSAKDLEVHLSLQLANPSSVD